jgi:carboxyl-terminal processing protease
MRSSERGIMNRTMRKFFVLSLYSLFLTASALFAGYQAHTLWPPASEEYKLLKDAYGLLDNHYISELPDQLLLERGMIRGMLTELNDPYTFLVDPELHELQTDDLAGEYGGVGAYINRDEEMLVHLIPFDDGPAARAGILESDILIQIDDWLIKPDASIDRIVASIRGPVGTSVNLVLAPREIGGDSHTIDIVREAFPIPSVTGYLLPSNPNIGVIVISIFSEKTPQEVRDTYHDLTSRGGKAIILDLRNNNGGLLDSGIDVARFFLSTGVILIEERRGGEQKTYRAETNGELDKYPLATLINGMTASAAEVVAAALQANDIAPLIGEPTFGKGSVQVVLELSDHSSLHITSTRWITPDGVILDKHGLQPDILITSDDDIVDASMAEAVKWFQLNQ